jgi:hypothetical protein
MSQPSPQLQRRGTINTDSMKERIETDWEPHSSALDKVHFTPNGNLAGLLDNDTAISSALRLAKVDEVAINTRLFSYIRDEAPKSFAILALQNNLAAIVRLHKSHFTDGYLPIEYEVDDDGKSYRITSHRKTSESPPEFSETLAVFYEDNWFNYVKDFCKLQWHFLAPVFSAMINHQNLPKGTILPLVDEKVRKGSTFSTVWKVCIQSKHNQELVKVRNLPILSFTSSV